MALQYYPLHGRWGTVTVDGAECAEVTDVEGEVQINRVDVLQAGNRWKGYLPGEIEGSGSMTVMKANSWFESFIYDWVSNGPASGNRSFKITLTLDDPHYAGMPADKVWGNNESITLDECSFWNLPVGYQRGSVIQRRYNFTFSGLAIASGIKSITKDKEPGGAAVDTTRQAKL